MWTKQSVAMNAYKSLTSQAISNIHSPEVQIYCLVINTSHWVVLIAGYNIVYAHHKPKHKTNPCEVSSKYQQDNFASPYWPSTYTSVSSLNSNCGPRTIVGYVLTSAWSEGEGWLLERGGGWVGGVPCCATRRKFPLLVHQNSIFPQRQWRLQRGATKQM